MWATVGREMEGIGGRYLKDCQELAPFHPITVPRSLYALRAGPETIQTVLGPFTRYDRMYFR